MSLLLTLASPVSAAAFAPTDIAGLTLWLKADAITGKSDGDPIASWLDSSGLGNNAAQVGADATRPTYKTNIVNGKPVARFTDFVIGDPNYLQCPSLTSYTGFAVCSHADGATFTSFRRVVQPASGSLFYCDSGTSNYVLGNASAFKVNGVSTLSAAPLSSVRVLSWVQNPADTGLFDIGGIVAIASQTLFGDLAEAIIYSGAITAGERANVESYLASKYGL